MERLLVIKDKNLRKELDTLLLKYPKSILLDCHSETLTKHLLTIAEGTGFMNEKEQRLLINTANSSILVKVEDIVRCQSNRNYTEVHLQNKSKITVSKPLKQFEEMQILKGFARVHLSHLVNIKYIDRFIKTDGGSLVLTDGTRLPVSKRRKDEWIKKLEIV